MKKRILMAFLIASVMTARAFSQSACGTPAIDRHDLQSQIQNKMNCFANENADLRAQLASAKAELESAKQISISTSIKAFDMKALTRDTCKSRAIDSAVKRGWTFHNQDNAWLWFTSGSNWLQINCGSNMQGLVSITGHYSSSTTISDATSQIANEVFPQ